MAGACRANAGKHHRWLIPASAPSDLPVLRKVPSRVSPPRSNTIDRPWHCDQLPLPGATRTIGVMDHGIDGSTLVGVPLFVGLDAAARDEAAAASRLTRLGAGETLF